MILLTVGTQLPFDRLVQSVDEWAKRNPDIEIFAQIANGTYLPKHMPYISFLDNQRYTEMFDRTNLIIAHAGMGTVINSLMENKPVIVYPRKASLGEHRNEHQLATCNKLTEIAGCHIAYQPEQLHALLDNHKALEGGALAPFANDDLLDTVNQFIASAN